MSAEIDAWLAARSSNPVLERLARRLPVLALGVRYSRSGDIARYAHASGHHAIWVDLEHSTMAIDTAAQICSTALDLGLVGFVRVPEREYGVIGRLLDGGALGIIAPRIETAEQAADLVAACRFPPLGHRSAIASLPQLGFRKVPAARLYDTMNRATALKVLIESPLGVENAEAIASTPGVDIVGIGTNDLCAELGVPGDHKHPRVRAAHDHVLAACERAGKPLAVGGIPNDAYAADLIDRGAAPFLMTGIDSDILLAALHERAKQAIESFPQVFS